MELLKGTVCRASNGDIGIVCHKDGKWYYGIGLLGGCWRSRNPEVVAQSVAELIGRIFHHKDDGILIEMIDNDASS